MGRSRGFGSTPYDLSAHFTLAFTVASLLSSLTLPHRVSRRLIMQKVRRHSLRTPLREAVIELRLLVSARFQVL